MVPPILEVNHLSISFTQYGRGTSRREVPALRGLDLTLRPGQLCAVVGASGSGKSLLAHCLLGLLPYNARQSGDILFDGEPLTPTRAARLRGKDITLIPQGVSYLDPLMTVGNNLRQGRRGTQARADARQAMGQYGLGPETEALYPFQLSGGMARRVLIASAVQHTPQLVIADEPTPGLDEATARRVLGHFREQADSGAAVLLITHDLELALTVAHRVTIFYAGTSVEEAPAEDFAREDALRHPYTQALWRAMPAHGFQALPGTQPPLGAEDRGCPFAPRCPRRQPVCEGPIPVRHARDGWARCVLAPEGGEEA